MSLTANYREPSGPYAELSRADWATLAQEQHLELDTVTLSRLRTTGEPISLQDVADVYLPLTQLITLYLKHMHELHKSCNSFLNSPDGHTPFIIGVAGSVAVGKSTAARLLQKLLTTASCPKVDLVPTDGFLHPNAELKRRGILHRKGFPESYDRKALLQFVIDVKSGVKKVSAPVYSHLVYDIVPGQTITVTQPDILIIEGLNVLQPAPKNSGNNPLAISDFFDFSVYVDADEDNIKQWYLQRFMRLRETAFLDPNSYFHRYTKLSDREAKERASYIWDTINSPNLKENIAPTRGRATAILRKGENHRINQVQIRKI